MVSRLVLLAAAALSCTVSFAANAGTAAGAAMPKNSAPASARATAKVAEKSKSDSDNLVGGVLAAGVIAGGVIIATDDKDKVIEDDKTIGAE